MADNIKFSRHKDIRGRDYQHYDNFDAIEVPYTDAIPGDYDGVMGVPISFLDKYCPEQFEILDTTERWASLRTRKYNDKDFPNANDLNATWVVLTDGVPQKGYKRLLIRKRL